MSKPSSPDAKFLDQIIGLTPETLKFARDEWSRQPVMRKVIGILAHTTIEEKRTELETCDLSQVDKVRGEISGIRLFLAAINAQATAASPKPSTSA